MLAILVANTVTTTAADFKFTDQVLTVPDGFEIELVAGPPLITSPIVADFDEQGRLYVAESSGSNDKVEIQLAEKPHRIVRLEDTDGDGVFDTRVVFAEGMMLPQGTLWYDGSLYVAAAPSIWKLTDTDGDGIADQRSEWFQGKTLTGCANDLHGPYLGRDGWIYWTKGAFAEQTYERPGRKPLVTRASHIFRARPDGSQIESVMTGGMDNPVDVAFSASGERFLTATFLQLPGGGLRDGLIHALYGGLYGKVHAVLDGHPRTQPEVLPALAHLGSAAPSGLEYSDSAAWGPEYQGNLYAALFNLSKVTRHRLVPDGAGFTTVDQDFVVSNSPDFHPTDVLEDADGSLLVIDTGGWYKLCCPTSQLVKPDLLGGIYRVRPSSSAKGLAKIEDPRGLKLDWQTPSVEELITRLHDNRPAVREHAIQQLCLSDLKPQTVALLAQLLAEPASSPAARLATVWALTRVTSSASSSDSSSVSATDAIATTQAARDLLHQSLSDQDETVRSAAAMGLSVSGNESSVAPLIGLLKTGTPSNQRAASEALGRLSSIPTGGSQAVSSEVVAAIFEVFGSTEVDPALRHSLTYALFEIENVEALQQGLSHTAPSAQQAALIALDQLGGGYLEAEQVVALLDSTEAPLRDTAAWIVSRHPEWSETTAKILKQRLLAAQQPEVGLTRQIASLAQSPVIQAMLAEVIASSEASVVARLNALDAIHHSTVKQAPAAWIESLAVVIDQNSDPALTQAAVLAVRKFPLTLQNAQPLVAPLNVLATNEDLDLQVRLASLAAMPGGLPEVDPKTFGILTQQLEPESSFALRSLAAEVVARSRFTSAQLLQLADLLEFAGPLEIERLLAPYNHTTDPQVGLKLVDGLRNSRAVAAIPQEQLQARLDKFGPQVQQHALGLFAELEAQKASRNTRLQQLLASPESGDIRRGQAVFNSAKAACASCHAIGYLGGKVGPDLTRIGQIRSERDLLEAIVFPSASFVRSYESVMVSTVDGRVFSGVVIQEAPEEIVLQLNATEQVRLPRVEIEEMQAGTVSIMPSGLDEQLSTQELVDLLAFLKACQ